MMKPKNNTVVYCYAYTILWQLYQLQGVLEIGGLAKLLLIFLVGYSLYKVIDVNLKYKLPLFLKGVNILLLMFSIYGLIYLIVGEVYIINAASGIGKLVKSDYLKNIFCSLPVIYVYYDFAQKGVFRDGKNIMPLLLILLGCSIINFFAYYALAIKNAESRLIYVDGLTNNMGYKFVPLMALCLLAKKWRFPIICVCMVFIVLSLKRGAMVVGVISFVAYFYMLYKNSSGWRKKAVMCFFATALIIGGYITYDFYKESEGLQRRFEKTMEGDSSGRDVLYSELIEYYPRQESTLAMIFGNGPDATVKIAGNYAHNDWIEILINQGILGIVIFAMFYILWYRNLKQISHRAPENVAVAFGLLLLGSFVSSIFSMSYTGFSSSNCIPIGVALTYSVISKRKSYGAGALSD